MDKDTIKSILENQVYTNVLSGEERFRGLLGEFFEEGAFAEEEKIDNTPFRELKTVEDVEKLLSEI